MDTTVYVAVLHFSIKNIVDIFIVSLLVWGHGIIYLVGSDGGKAPKPTCGLPQCLWQDLQHNINSRELKTHVLINQNNHPTKNLNTKPATFNQSANQPTTT